MHAPQPREEGLVTGECLARTLREPLPWHPTPGCQAGSCRPLLPASLCRDEGNSPIAGVQIYRLRTPVAGEIEESPLDQYPHPHVHLLVRCLDGRQTHPSTGDTSGIRRVLYGHSVAESVKTDKYKEFLRWHPNYYKAIGARMHR